MVANGSPDDIKKRFGIGYNLLITHEHKEAEMLKALVESHVDRAVAELDEQKSRFTLPFDAVSQFPALFKTLESRQVKFSLR